MALRSRRPPPKNGNLKLLAATTGRAEGAKKAASVARMFPLQGSPYRLRWLGARPSPRPSTIGLHSTHGMV